MSSASLPLHFICLLVCLCALLPAPAANPDSAPLRDVAAIAAGSDHTCALTTGGGVRCWGYNASGRLGDGTITSRWRPVDVSGLTSGVQAVSAGDDHTCALTTGGGVQCWGDNFLGQLGNGERRTYHMTPVAVSGLSSGVQAATAGSHHTCALTTGGGVKCWGNDVLTPADVAGLSSGVQAIATSDMHTCALTTGGGVKCWGDNQWGQVGDGASGTDRLTPVDVAGLASGVQAIAAGSFHTCALTAGRVKCWGGNGAGQLGTGTSEASRLAPVAVNALDAGVQAVAAGSTHTCALTAEGGVRCWGDNFLGQLGDGGGGIRTVPTDVNGLSSGVQTIAAGQAFTCVLTTGNGIQCWGDNSSGQLGDGTAISRWTAATVNGLTSGVQAISAGSAHICALTTGGGVKCWGSNSAGQLGDGATGNRPAPVYVAGLASGVQAISAGSQHTCALTTSGGVKCWGSNSSGQLGDGTIENHTTPVYVAGLASGVQAISAGSQHTCVVTAGGGVKCWGDNFFGQIGDGTSENVRLTPLDVAGLANGVRALAAGSWHTCALTAGAGVKCWGSNGFGQLGTGTEYTYLTPVDVVGLNSGVRALTTKTFHTCTLSTNGGVHCWGAAWRGQIGDGTNDTDRLAPVNVIGLAFGVQAIAVGGEHTCALTSGGVKCWGDNSRGQLGIEPGWQPVDVAGPEVLDKSFFLPVIRYR